MNFDEIFERLEKLQERLKFHIHDGSDIRVSNLEEHKNRQIDEHRKISRRVDEIEEKLQNLIAFRDDTIPKEKRTGLNFYEAFNGLMNGKKIHRKSNYGNIIVSVPERSIFSMNDIRANDWEIFE